MTELLWRTQEENYETIFGKMEKVNIWAAVAMYFLYLDEYPDTEVCLYAQYPLSALLHSWSVLLLYFYYMNI